MKGVLNIDWLSFHGSHSGLVNTENYKFNPRSFGTKIFEEVIDYNRNGETYFTVTRKPRSKMLKSELAIVKIANFILYKPDKYNIIETGLKEIGFMIKGVSRFDICFDFNYFANGWDGHTLIKQFLESKALRNGRGNFSVHGVQKFDCNFEYLGFGGNNSSAKAYLYNKTKEMQDVKEKPYIREQWERAGLRQDVPVYRLEFSLNSDGVKNLENPDTTPIGFTLNNFGLKDFLPDLYYTLYDRFFDFRKNNRTRNKSRMERINLIEKRDICMVYNGSKSYKCSGRMEKILLHNLFVYVAKYGDGEMETYDTSKKLLNDLLERTQLHDYVSYKKGAWLSEMSD